MSGPSAQPAAVPGRFSRTAALAVLATLLGGNLFEDADDPWLTVAPFVLVVFATSALTAELTAQAQRGGDRASGWSRSDTAIAVTLAALASVLAVSSGLAGLSAGEHTAAACFAALHVLLVLYFAYVRGKTVRGRPSASRGARRSTAAPGL